MCPGVTVCKDFIAASADLDAGDSLPYVRVHCARFWPSALIKLAGAEVFADAERHGMGSMAVVRSCTPSSVLPLVLLINAQLMSYFRRKDSGLC